MPAGSCSPAFWPEFFFVRRQPPPTASQFTGSTGFTRIVESRPANMAGYSDLRIPYRRS